MANSNLQQQIRAFADWKQGLARTVEDLSAWLQAHDQAIDSARELRLYEALQALRNDRINIACVAEFSRGKTELINALFFADYQRRLLPSAAGRTTMCPTELFYDQQSQSAYIRLLAIETRLEDQSLLEFKNDPAYWTHIPLNPNAPEHLADSLSEVVRTKRVTVDQAHKLGLYAGDPTADDAPAEVEIPVWRHALVSFPHPLLQQGVAILDTPGLNALGNEPELTLALLPAAQAVFFILAADAGVTRSDRAIWDNFLHAFQQPQRQRGLTVILNKIDVLWDDLKTRLDVERNIQAQCEQTADLLQIPGQQVFAVSAQKGLLAKVRQDPALLEKSQLEQLERHLCQTILPAREAILREQIQDAVGQLLETQEQVYLTRWRHNQDQLAALHALQGENGNAVEQLLVKTRKEQTVYIRNVGSFQASRRILQRQTDDLLTALSLDETDQLINRTRHAMVASWTTSGLKKAMRTFFDAMRERMDQVQDQADQSHRLIRAIYKKFHVEHGFAMFQPQLFSVGKYLKRMQQLYQDAEAFRRSPVTAMTEQNLVVKKFFINLASAARDTFAQARQDAALWAKEVMTPLAHQIMEHKQMMEQRLTDLRKASESQDSVAQQLRKGEDQAVELNAAINALREFRARLAAPAQAADAAADPLNASPSSAA